MLSQVSGSKPSRDIDASSGRLETPEQDLEAWVQDFFTFMDVNSNNRVSMGDFVSSLDVLNVRLQDPRATRINQK